MTSPLRWRMRLLGTPCLEITSGDHPVLPLKAVDAAWVCALALDGAMPRDDLVALVWPLEKRTLEAARGSLRERLRRLRRDAAQLAGAPVRLFEMDERAALADDMDAFEWPAVAALAADPGAWDGTLGGDHDLSTRPKWRDRLELHREQWCQRRVSELARLCEQASEAGQTAEALAYAWRWSEDVPLDDQAVRALMRLQHLSGDRAGAQRSYRRFESALREELKVEPAPETQELAQALSVTHPSPAAPRRALPLSLKRPPVLIARDDALAWMAQAHEAGAKAVLVGEAGIGKSRLIEAWADALAERGVFVLHVTAAPGDSQVPFAMAARLLQTVRSRVTRQLPPSLTDRLAFLDRAATGLPLGRTGVQQLSQALQDLLRLVMDAPGQPLRGLALDDLHSADAVSVEIAASLISASALSTLSWVLAHRPLPVAGLDGAMLSDLYRGVDVRVIKLDPWNETDLQRFVGTLGERALDQPGLAAALLRHAGGHPLYTLETLRALVREGAQGIDLARLPLLPSLGHLLDARLLDFSPAALQLAQLAAVAIPDFSVDLAEHVIGKSALELSTPWLELEAAGVFQGLRFAHDLMHDAARRSTPQVIRAHLSRRVAEFLSGRAEDPARLAAHWAAAGCPLQAAECYLQAARRVTRSARAQECARLLDQAAAMFEQAGEAGRAFDAQIERVTPLLHSAGGTAALAL